MGRDARGRGLLELTAAVGLPAVAVVVLHRLGAHPRLQIPWSDLEVWLQAAPVDDVAASLLRLVGLAAAYWVLTSTALYLLARLTRVPAAIRAVEWAALPPVRRAADRTVALALVGSTLGGPAGAAFAAETTEPPGPPLPPPPPVVQFDEPDAVDPAPAAPEPTPAGPPGPPPPATDDDAEAPMDTPAEPAEAPDRGVEEQYAELGEGPQVDVAIHEVVAGDNLWTIAEQVLAETWGRAPSATEISVYWWELIDRNLSELRSGDPDLIYPGERLALPATPADARGGQP